MKTLIVTRHRGAVEWIRHRLCANEAQVVEHLGDLTFDPGDRVLGVLPLALAARLCALGVEVYVIDVDTPPAWRGREMTADDLCALGASLVRYEVREIGRI